MARGRPLSKDIREAIIKSSRNGTSTYRIAKDLRVSRSTVQNILNLYKKTGNIIAQKKTGRPSRGGLVDFCELKKVINPNLNGVRSNIVTAPANVNIQQGINKAAAEIGKTYFVKTCNNGSMKKIKHEGNNNYRKYFPNYYDRTKKFDPQEPEVNILFENGDPNYSNENGDAMSMQQMDYFQEESQQYPEITSNQQHHNQQCNMSESAQSSQKPKKFKIKKKKGNTTLAATLESLQTVTKAISSTQDEFNLFGEYMAMSLRTMPLRNALRCKEKLLSIIVNERLNMNTDND